MLDYDKDWNKCNDVMGKHSMAQRKGIISADDPECDVMTKYAMLQKSEQKYIECPKCGDLQSLKRNCDKCGVKIKTSPPPRAERR